MPFMELGSRLSDADIQAIQRVGRNEVARNTTIALVTLDALCDEAIARGEELTELHTAIAGRFDIKLTRTKDEGIHSGRRRWRVECRRCGQELHEATTGPFAQHEAHQRNDCPVSAKGMPRTMPTRAVSPGVTILTLRDGRTFPIVDVQDHTIRLVWRPAEFLDEHGRLERIGDSFDPHATIYDVGMDSAGRIKITCHPKYELLINRIHCTDPWASITVLYNDNEKCVGGPLLAEPSGIDLVMPWSWREQLTALVQYNKRPYAEQKREMVILTGLIIHTR